jgi:hypothetical protein
MELKRKFTSQEVQDILFEEGIWDGDNQLFDVVYKEVIETDIEKSSVTYEVVIQDLSTKKFYRAELGKSQWYGQTKYNANQKWSEVKEKRKTITIYE